MRTKLVKPNRAPPLADIDRDPSGIFLALICCVLFGGACWITLIGLAARLV